MLNRNKQEKVVLRVKSDDNGIVKHGEEEEATGHQFSITELITEL